MTFPAPSPRVFSCEGRQTLTGKGKEEVIVPTTSTSDLARLKVYTASSAHVNRATDCIFADKRSTCDLKIRSVPLCEILACNSEWDKEARLLAHGTDLITQPSDFSTSFIVSILV